MNPGPVVVSLGFPTTNVEGPKVTNGRYARLTITDEASRMIVVDVRLSAHELLLMMAGQEIKVTEEVRWTEHPERIGLQRQVHSERLGRISDTEAERVLASAQVEAVGSGRWDMVTLGRHNDGKSLQYVRWRPAPDSDEVAELAAKIEAGPGYAGGGS
jgi:hypothetical protein